MYTGGGTGTDVLNVLRWSTVGQDGRSSLDPHRIQPVEPFVGHRPAVVTRAEFRSTGFTEAHLEGARFTGYRVTSTMVAEICRLLRQDEAFVYAYYDGVDKVAHEYGLGEVYDAELAFVDDLVAQLSASLPRGAALVVTADHGQVHVGDRLVEVAPEVMANVELARDGRIEALLEAAAAHHGDDAWVVTADQVIADGWFGPKVTDDARSRLGDVALVARTDVAFVDPADSGPFELVGRHGSLTPAEMYVPLLVTGG
jgi:hypothetical protein